MRIMFMRRWVDKNGVEHSFGEVLDMPPDEAGPLLRSGLASKQDNASMLPFGEKRQVMPSATCPT